MNNMLKGIEIGGLNIKVPIIQGGMGVGVSLSGLASSVANEGGVGVISVAGLGLIHKKPFLSYVKANIEGLKKEIRAAKKKSNGVLGVNIMVAMTNFADLVKTSINEKIDIIFAGAGLPLDLPKFLKPNSPTKLVPIVSSARAANIICRKWKSGYDYLPDAIVVEGPKAGGHLGFKSQDIEDEDFSLENIVAQVNQETKKFEEKYDVKIPIFAGGGIYTGKDMYNIMKLGADGVQLGTRFVTTKECDVSEEFKQLYIEACQNDVEIINSPVGMPGRAVKSVFLEKVKSGKKIPVKCPFVCIKTCKTKSSPYCIIQILYNAYLGKMDHGFAFAGTNAYRATNISTVKEVINELVEEWNTAYCSEFPCD